MMEWRRESHWKLKCVLLWCSINFCTVSSDPIKTQSVFNDETDCKTISFLRDSSYAAGCTRILLEKSDKIDDNLALCMTLKDIANRICIYRSKTSDTDDNIYLPTTGQEFDAALDKLQPKPEDYEVFRKKLCDQMPSIFEKINNTETSDSKLIPYVSHVTGSLLNPKNCEFNCHGLNDKIKQFCMVYLWTNKLFDEMKPFMKDTKVKEITSTKKEEIAEEGIQVQGAKSSTSDKVVKIGSNNLQKPPKMEPDDKKVMPEGNNNPTGKDTKQDPALKNEGQSDGTQLKTDNQKVQPEKNEEVHNEKPIDHGKENPVKESPKLKVATNTLASESQPDLGGNKIPDEKDLSALNKNQEDKPNDEANGNDLGEGNEDENFDQNPNPLDNPDDDIGLPPDMRDNNDVPKLNPNYKHPSIAKEEEESHFFTYFSVFSLLCLIMYIGFHNKQKILAMLVEGRRGRRARGSRRRPSTANYRKLDSNLEEAVTSQCSSNVTHVIY